MQCEKGSEKAELRSGIQREAWYPPGWAPWLHSALAVPAVPFLRPLGLSPSSFGREHTFSSLWTEAPFVFPLHIAGARRRVSA